MYVLAPNQTVETYPYSVALLKQDNPTVSFPSNPSDQMLADWNVFPVVDKGVPDYNPASEDCKQIDPTLVDGEWVVTWEVTPATARAIEDRTEDQAASVRVDRDQRLQASDWTQLLDSPLTAEEKTAWADYRQQLRDVTTQESFPWDVVWPAVPNNEAA